MIAVVSHVTYMWLNICWWCNAPRARLLHKNLPAKQLRTNVAAPFKLTDQKAQMIWSCHILSHEQQQRWSWICACVMQGWITQTCLTYHPCLTPQPSARVHLSQYLTEVGDHYLCTLLKSTDGNSGPPPTRLPAAPFSQVGSSNCSDGLSGNREPHRWSSLISHWSRHGNRKLRKGRAGISILIIKQLHFRVKTGHIKQGRGYNREQTSVFTYPPLNECGHAAQTKYNVYLTSVALKQTLRWKLQFNAATMVIKVKDV